MANSYLTRTLGTSTNAYKGTVSHWIKRSGLGSMGTFAAWDNGGTASNRAYLNLYNDSLYFYDQPTSTVVQTNRLLRDTSAWYHIVVGWDTSQATASDRVKIYVNGVQETSMATGNYPSQNSTLQFNTSGRTFSVGSYASSGSAAGFFNGYQSHFAFVDGQQLTPTSFGLTDSTSGIWKFKSPTGITWGTNGFHLKFENSGSLGLDSSGQTNNYTVNGSLKQSIDTPSNNFMTMNVLDNQNQASTFTMANTKIEWNTNNKTNFGAWSMNKGKWYWEMKYANITGGANLMIGIVRDPTGIGSRDPSDWPGHDNNGFSYYAANGQKYYNGSGSSYGNSFTTNDIVGVAFNADTRTLWFSKNGTWQNSATISEIAAGTTTNSAWTGIGSASNEWFPATSGYDGNKGEFNFGNGYFSTTPVSSAGTSSTGDDSVWEYDCPTGFYGLNTKNLNTYG
jgi:hypothetical protein